jgi:hypothetical protein
LQTYAFAEDRRVKISCVSGALALDWLTQAMVYLPLFAVSVR